MLQILCADVQVKQFFSWDTEIIQVRCRNVRCVRQTLREEDFNCYRSEKNCEKTVLQCAHQWPTETFIHTWKIL